MNYYEIYNEWIYDLLSEEKKIIEIREDSKGDTNLIGITTETFSTY